jgi:hypothetical protein
MGKTKALRRDRKPEGLNNETGALHGRTPASPRSYIIPCWGEP